MICVNGVWGTICGTGWNKTDVLLDTNNLITQTQINFNCITLFKFLFLMEPDITTNAKYGSGDGAIVYSNLNCQGWQRSFSECSKSSYRHFICSNTNIAGVLCTDGITKGNNILQKN